MSHDLNATARAIVAPGKGILAADESAYTTGVAHVIDGGWPNT